nr:hypothetical protein [Tanacetum cinerariifolium]
MKLICCRREQNTASDFRLTGSSSPTSALRWQEDDTWETRREVKHCENVLDAELVKLHNECNLQKTFLHNDPLILAVAKSRDGLGEAKSKHHMEVVRLSDANLSLRDPHENDIEEVFDEQGDAHFRVVGHCKDHYRFPSD